MVLDKTAKIYHRMGSTQRHYFDFEQKIGPYAHYVDTAGAWPERRAIEKYIRHRWGPKSQAMRYFKEVFRAPYD